MASGHRLPDRHRPDVRRPRQEWILLSDTLGVSMLLETINHRATGRPDGGDGPRSLEGRAVRGLRRGGDAGGRPIEGAVLDVWQTNGDGRYDVQQPDEQPENNMRGKFVTGADGRYWFRTHQAGVLSGAHGRSGGRMLDATGRHARRPAHIHFIVTAEGYEPVVTHIFVHGDPWIDSDAVFGVKESLIVPFELEETPPGPVRPACVRRSGPRSSTSPWRRRPPDSAFVPLHFVPRSGRGPFLSFLSLIRGKRGSHARPVRLSSRPPSDARTRAGTMPERKR